MSEYWHNDDEIIILTWNMTDISLKNVFHISVYYNAVFHKSEKKTCLH